MGPTVESRINAPDAKILLLHIEFEAKAIEWSLVAT